MTASDEEPDSNDHVPDPETASGRTSRAHVIFFASMVVLALMVTVAATTLHANNPRSTRARHVVDPPCHHVDINIGLNWDHCTRPLFNCDAEDGYLTRSRHCCPLHRFGEVQDLPIGCCEPEGLLDPRGGLFDAEVEFATTSSGRC